MTDSGQASLPGLHDLVAQRGPLGAVAAAEEVVSRKTRAGRFSVPTVADALAGRSGRLIAEVAAATAVREIEQGSVPATPTAPGV